MPRKPGEQGGDRPLTELEPEKEPYDEGYFGTEEEEGVEREREAPDPRDAEEPDRS